MKLLKGARNALLAAGTLATLTGAASAQRVDAAVSEFNYAGGFVPVPGISGKSVWLRTVVNLQTTAPVGGQILAGSTLTFSRTVVDFSNGAPIGGQILAGSPLFLVVSGTESPFHAPTVTDDLHSALIEGLLQF